MRFGIVLLTAMVLPTVAALAQTSPSNMQQLVDQKTADVTTTIGVFRNQIMADQTAIEAQNAQIEALRKKLAEHDKKPEAPSGPPQLGTGK